MFLVVFVGEQMGTNTFCGIALSRLVYTTGGVLSLLILQVVINGLGQGACSGMGGYLLSVLASIGAHGLRELGMWRGRAWSVLLAHTLFMLLSTGNFLRKWSHFSQPCP